MNGFVKIKKIKKIHFADPVPVFDIEVKKNHNFAVDTGLVVHNCEPYQYVKSAIYEQRLLIPNQGTTLLTEEFLGLERNNTNGKIDHSPSSINSKDSADAVTGACYTASQHAEEFAFDYGEDLSLMVNISGNQNSHEQMIVDFENEMRNALDHTHKDESVFKDFGLGKAVPLTNFNYLSDGIIVF